VKWWVKLHGKSLSTVWCVAQLIRTHYQSQVYLLEVTNTHTKFYMRLVPAACTAGFESGRCVSSDDRSCTLLSREINRLGLAPGVDYSVRC
jgi:hypothetical protein